MSTARILVRQAEKVYRFLRLDTTSDGSLLAFLDRDPRLEENAMVLDKSGIFVPEERLSAKPAPSAKFSVHTTGEVHRYAGGKRKGTIYIEPLYNLTRLFGFGVVSIPRPSRLDAWDQNKHHHDVHVIIDFAPDVWDRRNRQRLRTRSTAHVSEPSRVPLRLRVHLPWSRDRYLD